MVSPVSPHPHMRVEINIDKTIILFPRAHPCKYMRVGVGVGKKYYIRGWGWVKDIMVSPIYPPPSYI